MHVNVMPFDLPKGVSVYHVLGRDGEIISLVSRTATLEEVCEGMSILANALNYRPTLRLVNSA